MYTLAEATEKADDTKKETTKDENTNTETTEQTVAPPTGDNTKEFMYILMLMSGVAVVTMSYIYSKKLKNS